MKTNNNVSLAIVLRKVNNGYVFESLEQGTQAERNKKNKLGRKPAGTKVPNRLIKQIGISNQQMQSQMTPDPTNPLPIPQQGIQPAIPLLIQQQQISCQISRQTSLPQCPALWYCPTQISPIQRLSLPQFFSTSTIKTPQLYLLYRNIIISSYQQNPKRYLTKVAVRRVLRGDVNMIMRIHSFLEREGVINFAVGKDGNYGWGKDGVTGYMHQRYQAMPQPLIDKMPSTNQQIKQKEVDTDNMTITVINKNFSRTYRASCGKCKLVCGIVWWVDTLQQNNQQNNDKPQSNQSNINRNSLCCQCYNLLPRNQQQHYTKMDIVKKMQTSTKQKASQKLTWNIQQNIRLLDFMSHSHKKPWSKLLQCFNNKRSIEDIVLQFLQFPIANIDIGEEKERLRDGMGKEEQIGFGQQDYFGILKAFYQQSQYAKNTNKQLNDNAIKLNSNQENDNHTPSFNQLISLVNQKIMLKIQNLKQSQDLIQFHNSDFESFTTFHKNGIKQLQDHQKCTKPPSMSEKVLAVTQPYKKVISSTVDLSIDKVVDKQFNLIE